jgi:hypothetical protein
MRRFVSKHGATAAIIALLALNVVLIVPLISGRNAIPEPADAASAPLPTTGESGPSAGPSPSAAASSPDASAESTPSPDLVSGEPRRLLAANSDQVAWRAEPAGCGEESKIEVTTDGGDTWRVTDSGLKSVVRLRAFGDSSVFAIGADEDCKPVYAVDAYPGAEWRTDDSMLSETWFRLPDELNTVHDPQDKTSKPCGEAGLVDLAGRGDDQAAALCGDGSIRVRDGGVDWTTAAEHSDALGLSADDNRFVMAVQGSQCDGVEVRRFTLNDGELKIKKKTRCFKDVQPDAGTVAVSNHGGAMWLWAGDMIRSKP